MLLMASLLTTFPKREDYLFILISLGIVILMDIAGAYLNKQKTKQTK